MAAGIGVPARIEFPPTDVNYDGENVTTGTVYRWASPTEFVAGILPLTVWTSGKGYFSMNEGSILRNFFKAVARDTSTADVNINCEVSFTTASAGVVGRTMLTVNLATPCLTPRFEGIVFPIFAQEPAGGNTTFTGTIPGVLHRVASEAVASDPDRYTFRILTPAGSPALTGTLDFSLALSGSARG